MSLPELILNFILGVLASYLAAAIRARSRYVYLTLKSWVAVTKGLCYRLSCQILSLLKAGMVLAETKLTSSVMAVRSSPLALFITLAFLLITVIPAFKAGKELKYIDAGVTASLHLHYAELELSKIFPLADHGGLIKVNDPPPLDSLQTQWDFIHISGGHTVR